MSSIQEIKEEAKELSQEISKMTEQIEQKSSFGPSELFGVLENQIHFGEILTKANDYYLEHGYPQIQDVYGKSCASDHYHIAETASEFMELRQSITKMVMASKLGEIRPNELLPFMSESKEFSEFYRQLDYICGTACYEIPKDPMIAFGKRFLLTHTPAVLYSLTMENQDENEELTKRLKEQYQMYSDFEMGHGTFQFRTEIEEMFHAIDSKLKIQKEDIKVMQKK